MKSCLCAMLLLVLVTEVGLHAEDQPNARAGKTEPDVINYGGMTYEQALASLQSELNPSVRASALNALVQFAIYDHHAEEVARLLVTESRTIPMDFWAFSSESASSTGLPERALASLLERSGKLLARPSEELKAQAFFTFDEMRYWLRITSGIYRLAQPQRKVFEQAMNDDKLGFSARLLAKIAVEEADIQEKAMQESLDSIPHGSETSKAEFRQGDIVTVSIPAKAKDQQTSQESPTEFDFHTTVLDVLPNGILQLEGRRTVQRDHVITTYHFTGQVNVADVDAERKVRAEKVSDLVFNQQHKNLVWFSVQNFLEQIYRQLP